MSGTNSRRIIPGELRDLSEIRVDVQSVPKTMKKDLFESYQSNIIKVSEQADGEVEMIKTMRKSYNRFNVNNTRKSNIIIMQPGDGDNYNPKESQNISNISTPHIIEFHKPIEIAKVGERQTSDCSVEINLEVDHQRLTHDVEHITTQIK